MAHTMACRFHADTLRRLDLPYVVDPEAALALEARAAELGTSLPASLREWYAMRDGLALLGRYSNADHPIAIRDLGRPLRWRWPDERDCVREGLVPFLVENQAVCLWAVRLETGDDPPVVVARDPDLAWRPCTATFSSFVACQVWDHTEIWASVGPGGDVLLLQAQDVPLRPADLEFLRAHLVEKTTTYGWPGERQFRFELGDARLLVWDGADQADWSLAARTEIGLVRLARLVLGCGDLRRSLWSTSASGERLLGELRR